MPIRPLSTLFSSPLAERADACAAFDDGGTVTFFQLKKRIAAMAATLRGENITRGLLVAEDSLDFVVGMMGLLHAGADVVIPPNNRPGMLEALKDHYDAAITNISIEVSGRSIVIDGAESDEAVMPLDENRASIRIFTSGSTGEAKAVNKSPASFQAEAAALESLWGGRLGNIPVQAMVPHYHLYGLTFKICWPLMSGRAFDRRLFPFWEDWFAAIRPDVLLVTGPAHLHRMGGLAPLAPNIRPRFVLSAGSPLDAAGASAAASILGRYPHEIFGATETGAIAWRDRADGAPPWQPLPGVRVLDRSGKLFLESPFAMGANSTEDRIDMVEGGRFRFLGRDDRVHKIGGKRISLGALEQALAALDEVASARVVALGGARPVLGAAVRLSAAGITRHETEKRRGLVKFLRDAVMRREDAAVVPKRWRFVEEFPVDALGKVNDTSLQALFERAGKAQAPAMPETVAAAVDGTSVRLTLAIDAGLRWFEGHFPGHPVLPAVVQLDWVATFAERYLGLPRLPFCRFSMKCRKTIAPGDPVELEIAWREKDARLTFTYANGDDIYSLGTCRLGSL
ncbi:MAG: AMP-binding protein [Rhodospirillales bacterium]